MKRIAFVPTAVLVLLTLSLTACQDREITAPVGPEKVATQLSSLTSSFRYTALNLGTLGGTQSTALAINDAGQVVGNSENFGRHVARRSVIRIVKCIAATTGMSRNNNNRCAGFSTGAFAASGLATAGV